MSNNPIVKLKLQLKNTGNNISAIWEIIMTIVML